MLLNNFFTFTDLQADGNMVKTNITLNASHPIFQGHFPGQPVLPGVCMMQVVKEVLEAHINKKTKLLKAAELKFLAFVRPDENNLVQMELKTTAEGELLKIDARLLDGETILFKFKGIFMPR